MQIARLRRALGPASGLNTTAAGYVLEVGPEHLDALAATWTCDLLGLPSTAVAAFCGGATVANLTGILAGRDALLARLGWDVDRRGLAGAPRLRVVTGAEAHSSVFKALRMAGIGRDAVTTVPTDECGRLVAAEFPVVATSSPASDIGSPLSGR